MCLGGSVDQTQVLLVGDTVQMTCDNLLTHLRLVLYTAQRYINYANKELVFLYPTKYFFLLPKLSKVKCFTIELCFFAILATKSCTSGTGGVNEASWCEALTAAAVFGEMGMCWLYIWTFIWGRLWQGTYLAAKIRLNTKNCRYCSTVCPSDIRIFTNTFWISFISAVSQFDLHGVNSCYKYTPLS